MSGRVPMGPAACFSGGRSVERRMNDRPAYEEITPWPAWVGLLVIACLGAAFVGVWQSNPQDAVIVVMAALPVMLLSIFLLGRLRVRVMRDAIVVGFGYLDLIRKRIPFADIQRIEAVKYSPLGEFGGWGMKRGFGGKRAW